MLLPPDSLNILVNVSREMSTTADFAVWCSEYFIEARQHLVCLSKHNDNDVTGRSATAVGRN